MKTLKLTTVGYILIIIGIAGLLISGLISYTKFAEHDTGGIPAASFMVTMIGMSLAFPTLLQENKGELSTMRIIVFSVTMVFCFIYIKLAWNAASFENFSIDQTWIYILGLAFGSKAFQKYSEEKKINSKKEEEE